MCFTCKGWRPTCITPNPVACGLCSLQPCTPEAFQTLLLARFQCRQVMGERDILGSQLIRRNDELALLYEKVKLQAAALARGAVQYRDRCMGQVAVRCC